MNSQQPSIITNNPKDLSAVFKVSEPLNLGDRLKELRDKRILDDKRNNRKNWDGVDEKIVEKIEELEGHSQYLRTEEQAIDQKKEQILFRQRHQLKAAAKTMADKLSSVISSEKEKLLDVFERQLNESRVPKSPANSFYTNSRLNRTANSLDRSNSQMLNVSVSSASNQQSQYALIHRYFKDPHQQSQSSSNILIQQDNSKIINTTQSIIEGQQENIKMNLPFRQRNNSCSETYINHNKYTHSNSYNQRDQLTQHNQAKIHLQNVKQPYETSNSSDKQKNTISIETIRQTSSNNCCFPFQNHQQTLDISNQKATWRQKSLDQENYLKNSTVDIISNQKTLSNNRHLEKDSDITSFRQVKDTNIKQRCATTPSAEEYNNDYPQELRDCTNHTTLHSINDQSNNKYGSSSQYQHSAVNFTSLCNPFEGDRKLSNASSSFRISGINKNYIHNRSNDLGFIEKDTLSFSNHAIQQPQQFQFLQKDSLQTSVSSSRNNHNLSTQFKLSDIADTKKSLSKNGQQEVEELQESGSLFDIQKQQYQQRIYHLERQVFKLKVALKSNKKSNRIQNNLKNKNRLANHHDKSAVSTKQLLSLQQENTQLKMENQRQKAALHTYSEQLECLFESIFANEKELKQLKKTQKANNKDIEEIIQAQDILAQATADFKDQVHNTIKGYSDRLNVINSQELYFQQLQQENMLLKESRDLVLGKMTR